MKCLFSIIIVLLCSQLAWSQQIAQVQFIHNVPDKSMDIYVNGQLYINDLFFRAGTNYVFIPSGEATIGIAPANSQFYADTIKSFKVQIERLKSHHLMFAGKEMSSAEAFVFNGANPYAATNNTTGITFANGGLDVPNMDFVTLGFPLFNDIAFGEFSESISIPLLNFEVQLTSDNQSHAYLSHNLDLSFWRGRTAFIFTSGYADGRYPALQTNVVLSNGASFPLETIDTEAPLTFAKVQLIHNAIGENIDVYIDDMLWQDDLVFRQATPFIEFPANRAVVIGVAPNDSSSHEDIVTTFTVNLEEDNHHILMMNGAVDLLDQITLAQSESIAVETNNEEIGLTLTHGSTNNETVSFHINDDYHIDDLLYNSVVTGLSINAANTTITLPDRGQTYEVNFNFWKGKSACIFTSGNADNFQLRAVLSNGASFPIQLQTSTSNLVTNNFKWEWQNGTFLIQSEDTAHSPVQLSLIDINGKILYHRYYTSAPSTFSVSMMGLPPNIYFIHLKTPDYQQTEKIYWHPD